jgi:hypothetical protein
MVIGMSSSYGTCLFIKINHRNVLECKEICLKLLELYGGDAFSDSEVCYWSSQFLIDRENVEDSRITDRRFRYSASNSGCIGRAVICICSMHCRACVYSCINSVSYNDRGTGPRFRHWRWAPYLLSEGQKADGTQQALLFLVAVRTAKKWGGQTFGWWWALYHLNQTTDWIMDTNQHRIASKSASDEKSD